MKCAICGKESNKMPYQDIDGNYYCSDECHHEHFWNEALSDPNTIIINGTAYTVGPENSGSSFRGFDGRRFVIEKNDGTIIETTNLWHRGDVPKDRYTGDTAKWKKE